MTANSALETYFSGYNSVVAAAEMLADTIKEHQDSADFAAAQLQRAVDDMESSGASAGRLGFASRGERPEDQPEPSPEQTLILSAADARLSELLLAASRAVGEEEPPAGTQPLENAVRNAQTEYARVSSKPAVMGFRSDRAASPNVSAADAAFRKQFEETLERILSEAEKTVKGIVGSLSDQVENLVKAAGHIADLFDGVTSARGLLRRAWDRLVSAVRAVYGLIAAIPTDKLQEQFRSLQHAVSIRGGLEYIFQTGEARKELTDLRFRTVLMPEEIDSATDSAAELAARFTSIAGNARAVASVIGIAASLFAAKLTGPLGAFAAPAAYSIVAGAVIVVGAQFADAQFAGSYGRGLRDIARDLGDRSHVVAG